jgi:hypothetical protein
MGTWQRLCSHWVIMELSPSPEYPSKGRIETLFARIQQIKQHALTVQTAFRAEAMKADAQDVISALQRAEAWLAAAPDVAAVEDLVETASRRLSSLGSLQRSPCIGGPARRAGDRLPAGASLPRRLRDRRAPTSATSRLVSADAPR